MYFMQKWQKCVLLLVMQALFFLFVEKKIVSFFNLG